MKTKSRKEIYELFDCFLLSFFTTIFRESLCGSRHSPGQITKFFEDDEIEEENRQHSMHKLFVPHRGKWRFIQRNFLNSRWIGNLVVKRNSLNERTKLKNEINEFDDDKLTKFAEQSMTKCCWWLFNSQDFSSNQFRNWRWPPSVLSLTKQGWPGPRDYYCECACWGRWWGGEGDYCCAVLLLCVVVLSD